MKLRIHCHPSYLPEREYVFHVLLKEFLGMEYECVYEVRHDVAIFMDGEDTPCLIVADCLFQSPDCKWLTSATLPRAPFKTWDTTELPFAFPLVDRYLPILFECPAAGGTLFCESQSKLFLGVDIFGTAFYFLSRYEEVIQQDKDVHGRFPASAFASGDTDMLFRPLVNEYLELLYACLQRLWPSIPRMSRSFQVLPTHDIDWPRHREETGFVEVLRQSVGDIVKRQALGLAFQRIVSKCSSRFDMYDTFDYMMTVVERAGLRSEFYLITDHTAGRLDGVYGPDDAWIRRLLREIHARGHVLGLHPSYHSYLDADQIRTEFSRLLRVAEEEGIKQVAWGGRQHYLRWQAPHTWANWEVAGLHYDSTLYFAQHAGFRSGVCYEYPVFDVLQRRMLRVRERPLILMEASLLQSSYMGTSEEESTQIIDRLKSTCRLFSGTFLFLWHNSQLFTSHRRRLFEYACERNH